MIGSSPDTTPPVIEIMVPAPNGVDPLGTALVFSAADAGSGMATPTALLTSAAGESNEVADGFQPAPGVYTMLVTASDHAGNRAASNPIFFVIYDPAGDFATGGGWIPTETGS